MASATLTARLVGDASKMVQEFDQVEKASGGMASKLTRHWKEITAAGVALGTGIEALARSQAANTQAARRLSEQTGMQEREVRKLATSLATVDSPIEDVIALMEAGTRQGVEGADALKQYAEFWDLVGDATGLATDTLTKAAPALRTVGVDMDNLTEAQAALGFVQTQTEAGVEGFLQLLEMRGAAIREFGLDVDDTAALLAVMEREMGLVGRQARQEFEQALNSADGTVEGLLTTLGISEEQFARYRSEVDASGSALEGLAEANTSTFTPMEKLKHMLDEQIFAHGELIQNAANLAPLLLALGPAMGAVHHATTVWTAAQGLLNAALSANPIGIVIVAIGALVAAGVLLWKNWDTVKENARELWASLRSTFSGIKDAVLGALDPILRKTRELLDLVRRAKEAIASVPGVSAVTGFAARATGTVFDLFKAEGGPVSAGNPYIVGERGPELFVPRRAGAIVPSHALGGALSVTFNINVQSLDPAGAADAVQRVLVQLKQTGRLPYGR